MDKNRSNGFVYQTFPKSKNQLNYKLEKQSINEDIIYYLVENLKRKMPPVRCELCKLYGHLSHTCTIKEVMH